MSTACNPAKIRAALFEEADRVTNIVRERIEKSDNIGLRMVKDGGEVARHSNQTRVIYGEAFQASRQYNDLDHSVRDLETGEMKGRTQTGANGIFQAEINDIDDNACHGQCTIDFAQGFRKRGFFDKEISVDTPVKCVRELDSQGPEHLLGYFRGFRQQFSRWGMDNFSDNLVNLIIQQSEANASVLGPNQFNVSSGGWQAPPEYRISIHFLQDYRDHIRAEIRGRGMQVPNDWMLEVEMPELDWNDAVLADQAARNPSETRYQSKILQDDEGLMKGRKFAVYGGIKCYFNESPIRGYFRPTGTVGGKPTYTFVRVYEWINRQDEVGGITAGVNHQYRADTVRVDGVDYDMVTLMPHIDPRSFKRYGLAKPIKPIGDSNVGVNYQVEVVEGAFLACNDFKDKFKLAARHEFRFQSIYPEFSGFIAYRHGRRPGYVIEVTPRDYTGGPDKPTSGETYDACKDDTGCENAECANCGKVADPDGQCVEVGAASAVINLEPAGAVAASFLGEAFDITFRVSRTGDTSDAAGVTWTTAHVTTTDADFLDATGNLSWAAGDDEDKLVTVSILGTFSEAVADTPDVFTLTLSSPTGDTLGTGTVATVSVSDLT